MTLDGRFWLKKEGKNFLGSGRVQLLKLIEKTGSMNAAAKEMKMSYKAAWERVNSMNELADKPLIERQVGGKGGGGSKLTPYAHELIQTFEELDQLHRQFIKRFSEASDSPEYLAKILQRTFLTTSARNQLLCKISHISYDNINATITMQLGSVHTLTSTITVKSMNNLNLSIGQDIYAIIKSSDIAISTTQLENTFEGNCIEGVLTQIESNETHSELTISIDDKKSLIAFTPNSEASSLQLQQKIFALIEYKKIILGT